MIRARPLLRGGGDRVRRLLGPEEEEEVGVEGMIHLRGGMVVVVVVVMGGEGGTIQGIEARVGAGARRGVEEGKGRKKKGKKEGRKEKKIERMGWMMQKRQEDRWRRN